MSTVAHAADALAALPQLGGLVGASNDNPTTCRYS